MFITGLFGVLALVAFGTPTMAKEQKLKKRVVRSSPKPLKHSLSFVSDMPIHSSLAYEYHFDSGVYLSTGVGFVPEAYYRTIGSVASKQGGNDNYADYMNAAFKENSLFRINLGYRFGEQKRWAFSSGLSWITTEGEASLIDVVQLVTGRDFTGIRNLLLLAGKTDTAKLRGGMTLGHIDGMYWIPINRRLHLSLHFGLSFVLQSFAQLSTELEALDNSALGEALLSATESDLEGIVQEYGVSPTLGLRVSFFMF